MKTSFAFSRRGPDRLTDELAEVLSKVTSFEFKDLFLVLYANLKAKSLANGGEEMLRLRTYEKLQHLVQIGVVSRLGKEYKGVRSRLSSFLLASKEANAAFASSPSKGPQSQPVSSSASPKAGLKKR